MKFYNYFNSIQNCLESIKLYELYTNWDIMFYECLKSVDKYLESFKL